MASTKESTTLTEAQTSFLALLMRNIQSKPDIDVSHSSQQGSFLFGNLQY